MDPRTFDVHFSTLKRIAQSPQHYLSALQWHQDAPHLSLGRLAHSIVLGTPYTIYEGRRAGKEWKEFEAAHAGEEIFTVSEHDKARRMADSVLSNADAARRLVGKHEVPLQWSIGGRACAGRADVIGLGYVTELKTTKSANPAWFANEARRYAYHAQLAWYLDGAGIDRGSAFIVAVESAAPYPCVMWRLTDALLEQGRALYRSWFERLLCCEHDDHWPGYASGEQTLDVDGGDDAFSLIIDGEEVAA